MRAAVVDDGTLVIAEVPDPHPPAGDDVVVRVTASPVHPGDVLGLSGAPGSRLGTEGAGVITSVGPTVGELSVGDRVAFFPATGAWSEFVTVPSNLTVLLPPDVSDEYGSAMLVNTITARQVLRAVKSATARHDKAPLIIDAATGSVAKIILLEAISEHFDVIALTRSETGARTVQALFPTITTIAITDGWTQELWSRLNHQPVPAIVDSVGGSFLTRLLPFLQDGGSVLTYGDALKEPITVSTSDLVPRELSIMGVSLLRWAALDSKVQRSDTDAAIALATQRPDLISIGQTVSFDQAADVVEQRQNSNSQAISILNPERR